MDNQNKWSFFVDLLILMEARMKDKRNKMGKFSEHITFKDFDRQLI